MSKALAILTLAVYCTIAAAQERGLREAREAPIRGAVTFRLASDQPQQGFDRMTTPAGADVYVSRKPAFLVADLSSVRVVGNQKLTSLELGISNNVAGRMATLGSGQPGSRMAIFVNGNLLSAPTIAFTPGASVMALSGLSAANAKRVVRLASRSIGSVSTGVTLVPDQRTGAAGDLFLVDVYVSNIDKLRGYQVALDATGGDSGKLVLDDIIINEGHADYVFEGIQSFNATDAAHSRAVNALPAGTVDKSSKTYLVTFSFRASPDAMGTFQIKVRQGGATVFLGQDSDTLPVRIQAATSITIR